MTLLESSGRDVDILWRVRALMDWLLDRKIQPVILQRVAGQIDLIRWEGGLRLYAESEPGSREELMAERVIREAMGLVLSDRVCRRKIATKVSGSLVKQGVPRGQVKARAMAALRRMAG